MFNPDRTVTAIETAAISIHVSDTFIYHKDLCKEGYAYSLKERGVENEHLSCENE